MVHDVGVRRCCHHGMGVVRGHLDQPGWPWVGPAGPRSTRVVRLGNPVRDRVLLQVSARWAASPPSWRLVFEDADAPASHPLLEGTLGVEELGSDTTVLVIRGRASAALVDGLGCVPDSLVRLAVNACARSFLEHIDRVWARDRGPHRASEVAARPHPT